MQVYGIVVITTLCHYSFWVPQMVFLLFETNCKWFYQINSKPKDGKCIDSKITFVHLPVLLIKITTRVLVSLWANFTFYLQLKDAGENFKQSLFTIFSILPKIFVHSIWWGMVLSRQFPANLHDNTYIVQATDTFITKQKLDICRNI